jgi:hypothetical protein
MVAAVAALQIALASGRVDGQIVLGRSIARVERLLGPPSRVERFPVRRDLRYAGIEVIFGDGRHVSSLLVDDPRIALPPGAMQQRLRGTAGLRESRPYHCDAKGCFGTFFTTDRARRVIYGVTRGRPYVGIQSWPA